MVYVDGFNLYYGSLRGTPFKWLNLKEFSERLLPPKREINKIKYYTARVSGSADPDQPRRQQIYLSALATVPEISVHYGNFLSKNVWRPVLNLPVANIPLELTGQVILSAGEYLVQKTPPEILPVGSYPVRRPENQQSRKLQKPKPNAVKTNVHWMEEKGSDVNLACHLVDDAWKDAFDIAVVVSNDTDLVEPIRLVITERRKLVTVVCPARKWGVAPALKAVASSVKHIHHSVLRDSQFPSPLPGTSIFKPSTW